MPQWLWKLLTKGGLADSIRRDLAERSDSVIVPHLLDVQVMSALRKLRHNFTAYAAYMALAEATNAVIYTSDEKLCKGHRARFVLFTR